MSSGPRIAFSTLAFPDADLATAVSLGRDWGYGGVELRLIDGELIDPSMPAAARAEVKRTVAAAGLPIVAVDSSIRLTGEDPGPELRRFLELASDWESPLVRVFGGAAARPTSRPRRAQLEGAARVLEASVPAAERLGVAVGVETHDSFSASSTVAELLALVESAVGRRRVGQPSPAPDGRAPRRDLAPTSADASCSRRSRTPGKSPKREDGWQLVLLGEGEVPVRDMLGLLAAARIPGLGFGRVGETLAP